MDRDTLARLVEQQYEQVLEMVRHHGHAVIAADGQGDLAPASFTVGAAKDGLPDLIVYGLPSDLAARTLNRALPLVKEKWPFPTKSRFSGILDGYDCILRDVSRSPLRERKMGLATMFNRRQGLPDNPIFQVCWPDKTGKFPWESGCAASIAEVQRVKGMAV